MDAWPLAQLEGVPHTTLIGVVKPPGKKERHGRKVMAAAATLDPRRLCGLTRSLPSPLTPLLLVFWSSSLPGLSSQFGPISLSPAGGSGGMGSLSLPSHLPLTHPHSLASAFTLCWGHIIVASVFNVMCKCHFIDIFLYSFKVFREFCVFRY